MAIIYVIPSPNFTDKVCYKSGGWPNATGSDGTDNTGIRQALAAAGVSGTVIIAAGAYKGTQLDSGGGTLFTAQTGATIRAAKSPDGDPSKVGEVVLSGNGASAHVVSLNHANTVIGPGIEYTMPASGFSACYVRADGVKLASPVFKLGNGSNAAIAVDSNCAAASALVVDNPTFDGFFKALGWSVNYNLAVVINNPIFRGINTTTPLGQIDINNPIFIECPGTIFNTTANSGKALTINNPVFSGNALASPTSHVMTRLHDQTWTINNGLTLGNPWANDTYNFNGVIRNNCISNKLPGFKKPKHPSVVVFCVDDTPSIEYFEDIAQKLEAKGWRGSFAFYTGTATSEQYAIARDLQSRGHEITCHSRNHAELTMAVSFSVQKAGETMACDGEKIVTSGGKTYLFANYTSANGNINKLRTDMITDGYTCGAIPAGLGADRISPRSLANFTNQAITSAFNLPIDSERFWAEEITGALLDMQAEGLQTNTFTPPGNVTSTDLRSWMRDNQPLIGSRGVSNDSLASANAYNISVNNIWLSIGVTTAGQASGLSRAECVKRNAAAEISRIESGGFVRCLLAHNTTEFTLDDWDSVIDVVAGSNVTVMTLREAIEFIKSYDPSGDLTSADGITYTRTLVDESDYHLLPTSPCIGAGVDVGLTTDADGNAVPGAVGYVIGPYSYMPGWKVFDGSMPDLTLAPTAPGDLKQVQAWSKVASAKEIVKL